VKDRARKFLNAYVVPLAVLFGAALVLPPIRHFGWHLLHGFHTETNGIRIWVPYRYRAVEVGPQHGVVLLPYPGIFRASDAESPGTITIDFVKANQDGERAVTISSVKIAAVSRERFFKMRERNLTMAGRGGQCVEYETDAESSLERGKPRKLKIECRFGDDLRAAFLGSSASSGTFYEIIASARTQEGKR
jgi:hypothetical protein